MKEPSNKNGKVALPANERISIKYRRHARCPKCKRGVLAYDGSGTRALPIGLGFIGARFQIDTVVYRGFTGECINCGQRIFAVRSVSHRVKYPKLGGAAR